MQRTVQHYRNMIAQNPQATIKFTLAACMIYASRHGTFNDKNDDRYSDEWRDIARELKRVYGEEMTANAVLDEMNMASIS